ncbi:N-formylglutamate amidohydrolase [Flavobacterium aciduliphilum]|uniref:N-formylglutamate amidohydrolase n=1 Tax=Flavobacterium aciduliphilum TaxID=1101402 RepID=A0A328YKS9_9FLAO|nr:N-formylglutamate amidohydrolase [Flavobacterium aciduliphilum]RAR73693.1 N-formylglutamate amidohydrolase [Flavobacterium aciduliphilum]
MRKLILHIPHSSINIPLLDGYVGTKDKIQEELVKLTDWYTDELFYSDTDAMIVAPFSRLFCDVERFENDAEEVMAKFGMGVLYERFDDGDLLRTVTPTLRENIIKHYYWKHHTHFTNLVNNELIKHETCLIIDCHSFPSIPLIRGLDQTMDRPDFNIGIDAFHTPKELVEASITYFKERGYSLGIDWPYSGTIVPMEHFRKNNKVYSIMLEVNRKLYLEEPTNKKSSEFDTTKLIVQEYLELLKKIV